MTSTKHIIVTEEQPIFRRLTEIILRAADIHKVTEAVDFEETMDLLHVIPVDILILYYEINGLCACPYISRIRDNIISINRNIPIVTILDPKNDVWLDSYVARQAMSAGATTCVSKPLSIRKLIPAIADALDLKFYGRCPQPRAASSADGNALVSRLVAMEPPALSPDLGPDWGPDWGPDLGNDESCTRLA